ncbi:MBL fold metallo-hydrolase [Pseudoxanthomonas sp. SGD-10]|nr:MBL fold metallo-hydrolase [Pseudoxanthomonas sp. SGD-10]
MRSTVNTDSKKRKYIEVVKGVWGMKILFVNIYMISVKNNGWVLVDAGLDGSADKIIDMAEELFGKQPPRAIILTHAHFDHVGALPELLKKWQVSVYAHPLEFPYLTGKSAYPPTDPFAGGGLMSLLSFAYPRNPINITGNVEKLTQENLSLHLPGWHFIHTPGHSPGHVSLFREQDRFLISGDAFVSTQQESAFSVATQRKKLNGPPRYFTTDWEAAEVSVGMLRDLGAKAAATGHGKPMYGEELSHQLDNLYHNFKTMAVPKEGRYVETPAYANERGVFYIPPFSLTKPIRTTLCVAAAFFVFATLSKIKQHG